MSQMLEAKRATRGLRMAELVGQAAEDDEQFWNDDIWNEDEDGSDAESFVEEEDEVKPDEFDSDFNDTETEEESGSDDEGKMQKSARAQKVKQSKSSNVYKDPTAGSGLRPVKRQLAEGEVAPKKKRIDPSMVHTGPMERTVRNSTKAKTVDAEETEKMRLQQQSKANRVRSTERVIRTQHIQKDLLLEGLETEETNNKWLVAQSIVENERAQADKPAKKATDESFIRHSSRRGTYNTITFSMVDAMPSILRDAPPPFDEMTHKQSQTCVITGLPAKYRDPRTLLPYATVDAFRELRRRYPGGRG